MEAFDLSGALSALGVASASPAGAATVSTAGAAGDSVLLENLPAHQYHSDKDALSCSLLKPLLISPAHFQTALVTPCPSSPAKDFGTLLHLLVLQPDEVASEVAVFTGGARRGSAWTEFAAMNKDKLIVDGATYDRAKKAAAKVLDTPYKGRSLGKFIEESKTEATVYFTDPTTGLRLRMRMDAYHPDVTLDLKSTRHALPRAFARDAVDLHYDLQGFMYSYGRAMYEGTSKLSPFVFVAAESDAPHSVSTLTAGESFIDNGAKKFQACLTAYVACTKAGEWPDLGSNAEIEIEPWQQFDAKSGWRDALNSRSA